MIRRDRFRLHVNLLTPVELAEEIVDLLRNCQHRGDNFGAVTTLSLAAVPSNPTDSMTPQHAFAVGSMDVPP